MKRYYLLFMFVSLQLFLFLSITGCGKKEDKKNGFEFIMNEKIDNGSEDALKAVDDSLDLDPGEEIENEHIEAELKGQEKEGEAEPFEEEAAIHSTKVSEIMSDSTRLAEALKNVLKTTKTSYELHLQLGNLYFAGNRKNDALIEYEKALELNQACKQAQLKLANLVDKTTKDDEYYTQINKYIEKFPKAVYLIKGRADHERRKKDFEKAAEDYKLAISIAESPDSALVSEYHRTLGMIHSKNNELEEAATEYQKAVDFNPHNGYAVRNLYLTLSRLSRKNGDFVKAADEAKKVLELYPNSTPGLYAYYYSLGMADKAARKFGPAIENFNKVLELMPEAGNSHKQVGICYYMTGNFDDAIFHLKKAVEINSEDYRAHYYLAKCYESKEWIELAKEEWSWCRDNSGNDKISEEAGVHLYLLDYLQKNNSEDKKDS